MTASGTSLPYDATAPSPRLAQELLNYILDYVEDFASLRSCSLAASCLRAYAQERLFTSIQVDATNKGKNIRALHDTLTSTSLATHVRRVKFIGQSFFVKVTDVYLLQDVLQLLASGGHTGAESHEMSREPTNSITHLQIQELQISERQLLDIMSSFPRLSTLEIISSYVSKEPGEAGNPEVHTRSLSETTSIPPLTELSFRETTPPEILLHVLANSKNIKLRSLDLFFTETPPTACQALAENAREHLEHFSIVPGMFQSIWPLSEGRDFMSLERHTVLRTLRVGYPDLSDIGIDRWLLALVQTLRSVVSDLEVFEIESHLVLHNESPAATFAVLDELLSEGPQFTRLRRVDIHARVSTANLNAAQHKVVDASTPQKIAKLSAWLPRLVQRGILSYEGEQVVPPAQPE